MYTSDQAEFQFIGNVTYNSAADIDSLPAGAVVVVDEDNNVKTDAIAATGIYRIVQKKADGNLLISPSFVGGDILTKSQTSFSPVLNQVSYFGASTTGTITGLGTHAAGNIYSLGIGLNNYGSVTTSEFYNHLNYTAVTGDTDVQVAKGLVDSAQRKVAVNPNHPMNNVLVERVAPIGSVAAITGSAVIYKFTKNSTTVATYIKAADATSDLTASTASATASDATTAISVASQNGRTFTFTATLLGTGAGRHVVFVGTNSVNVADAGTAAQNATAIAAALNADSVLGTKLIATASSAVVTITYKNDFYACPPMVVNTADDSTWVNVAVTITVGESMPTCYRTEGSTAAATFELDVPWRGETCYLYEGTGTSATAGVGIATVTSNTWGLKCSGKPLAFNAKTSNLLPVTFRFNPYVADTGFDRGVQDYLQQAAYEGAGTYKQVAYQEILTQFQNKTTELETYPPTEYKTEASTSKVYDVIYLRLPKELNSHFIGSNPKTFLTLSLAVNSELSDNSTLATVLGL